MITSLAWKNIWRNKVRSGVILGAIATGLFAGTYLNAFMSGWMTGTVNDEIGSQISHVQLHNPDFMANSDLNACFMRSAAEPEIARLGLTAATSYRLKLNGMLASANNAVGVTAKGVWVEDELRTTTIAALISDSAGAFLPADVRTPVVISRKTADKLKVRLRSKIVFTFQDTHGQMQSVAFRVSGIYKTSNTAFDEGNIFVRYADILSYTGLPDGAVHEAAIRMSDLESCALDAPRIRQALPTLLVQDWTQISPALSMSLAWTDMFAFIILVIFLFALSFGIVNTMLMAVLERTRELGMLGAIGMSKRSMFGMIMLETLFLTAIGSVAGIALGALGILPSMDSGIDLTFFMGDGFEDFGFSAVVYPILTAKMFFQTSLLVIAAGVLSAIYPALKALKLKPLEAIRT